MKGGKEIEFLAMNAKVKEDKRYQNIPSQQHVSCQVLMEFTLPQHSHMVFYLCYTPMHIPTGKWKEYCRSTYVRCYKCLRFCRATNVCEFVKTAKFANINRARTFVDLQYLDLPKDHCHILACLTTHVNSSSDKISPACLSTHTKLMVVEVSHQAQWGPFFLRHGYS